MASKAAEDRRRHILTQVRTSGHVEVTDVADNLEVAAETIRRDLKVLEEHGLVRRTHGGAYPVEGAGFETTLAYRAEIGVAEKRRIAAAAVAQLGDAESIFLDEGFTPRLVADALVDIARPITVITGSLPAATVLAASTNVTVILLGGRVRGKTLGVVDHWASSMLGELCIDLAILGANGISRERGLTVPDVGVGAVKQTAMRVSRRRLFVGAHFKFGVTSFFRFAEISDFETLITDTSLSASSAARYTALGPQVLRV